MERIRRIGIGIGIGNGDTHAKHWSIVALGRPHADAHAGLRCLLTIVSTADETIGMYLADTKSFAQIDVAHWDTVRLLRDRAAG